MSVGEGPRATRGVTVSRDERIRAKERTQLVCIRDCRPPGGVMIERCLSRLHSDPSARVCCLARFPIILLPLPLSFGCNCIPSNDWFHVRDFDRIQAVSAVWRMTLSPESRRAAVDLTKSTMSLMEPVQAKFSDRHITELGRRPSDRPLAATL